MGRSGSQVLTAVFCKCSYTLCTAHCTSGSPCQSPSLSPYSQSVSESYVAQGRGRPSLHGAPPPPQGLSSSSCACFLSLTDPIDSMGCRSLIGFSGLCFHLLVVSQLSTEASVASKVPCVPHYNPPSPFLLGSLFSILFTLWQPQGPPC